MTENFRIEVYCPERHYQLLKSWWEAHHKSVPPLEILSEVGIVICDDKLFKPIAMGWLYYSNSALAWIGFPVADPKAALKKKARAMEYLYKVALDLFRQSKEVKFVHCYSDVHGLTKLIERAGFVKASQHDVLFKTLEETWV